MHVIHVLIHQSINIAFQHWRTLWITPISFFPGTCKTNILHISPPPPLIKLSDYNRSLKEYSSRNSRNVPFFNEQAIILSSMWFTAAHKNWFNIIARCPVILTFQPPKKSFPHFHSKKSPKISAPTMPPPSAKSSDYKFQIQKGAPTLPH